MLCFAFAQMNDRLFLSAKCIFVCIFICRCSRFCLTDDPNVQQFTSKAHCSKCLWLNRRASLYRIEGFCRTKNRNNKMKHPIRKWRCRNMKIGFDFMSIRFKREIKSKYKYKSFEWERGGMWMTVQNGCESNRANQHKTILGWHYAFRFWTEAIRTFSIPNK